MNKAIFILAVSFILAACMRPNLISTKDSGIYLRADFTYWEARPEFKFKLNKEKAISYLKSDIKYDGQPYQFVVADRAWSSNKNCGYANKANRVLKYNTWLKLDCSYDADKNSVTPIQKPFEFLPKGSGSYLFELKLTETQIPTHIRVSAIKSKQPNSKKI